MDEHATTASGGEPSGLGLYVFMQKKMSMAWMAIDEFGVNWGIRGERTKKRRVREQCVWSFFFFFLASVSFVSVFLFAFICRNVDR